MDTQDASQRTTAQDARCTDNCGDLRWGVMGHGVMPRRPKGLRIGIVRCLESMHCV